MSQQALVEAAILPSGKLDFRLTPSLAPTFELAAKAGKAYLSTVMILGETGVGKTEIARHIHAMSTRRDKPFVKIDLSQASSTLFEDELFGHDGGAYTGAKGSRKSRLELADGGTVFLDEIGTLSFDLQAKLLRLVQERKFSRLGSDREIIIDVRFLVATSSNLNEKVRKGEFREDLFHRLNVVQILVPPLRERPADIIPLAEYFLQLAAETDKLPKKQLSEQTKKTMLAYDWPGNVRSLENEMKRATIITDGEIIEPHNLSFFGSISNVFQFPTHNFKADFLEVVERLSAENSFKAIEKIGEDAKRRALVLSLDFDDTGTAIARSARLMHCNQTTHIYRLKTLFNCPDSSFSTIRAHVEDWKRENMKCADQDDLVNQIVNTITGLANQSDYMKQIDDICERAKVELVKGYLPLHSFIISRVATQVGVSVSHLSHFLNREPDLKTWVDKNVAHMKEHGTPCPK